MWKRRGKRRNGERESAQKESPKHYPGSRISIKIYLKRCARGENNRELHSSNAGVRWVKWSRISKSLSLHVHTDTLRLV